MSTLNLGKLLMNGNKLTIDNWNGTTFYGYYNSTGGTGQLTQLMDFTSLTQAELNSISFYSGNGTGFLGTGIFSSTNPGEIIPVPEPTVVISGLFLLGWLIAGAARGRKKLKS
jgi:hypothetical protein